MGNLKTIRAVAQAFQRLNFDQVVRDSFEETKGSINLFDRENLRSGKLIDGSFITPSLKSEPYAAKKKLTGFAPLGTPDLFLTGSFQEGIGTIINSKSFTTFSTDEKSSKLELKYTKNIFGLPFDKRSAYVQIIGPVIFKKIKQATGL